MEKQNKKVIIALIESGKKKDRYWNTYREKGRGPFCNFKNKITVTLPLITLVRMYLLILKIQSRLSVTAINWMSYYSTLVEIFKGNLKGKINLYGHRVKGG